MLPKLYYYLMWKAFQTWETGYFLLPQTCHKAHFSFQWLTYIKNKNLLFLVTFFQQFVWLNRDCISFSDISDGQKLKKNCQTSKVAVRENALRKTLNGNPKRFWLSCCANLKPQSLQQYLFQPKMSLLALENLKLDVTI